MRYFFVKTANDEVAKLLTTAFHQKNPEGQYLITTPEDGDILSGAVERMGTWRLSYYRTRGYFSESEVRAVIRVLTYNSLDQYAGKVALWFDSQMKIHISVECFSKLGT